MAAASTPGCFRRIVVDALQVCRDGVLERIFSVRGRAIINVQFLARILDEGQEAGLLVGVVQIERAVAKAGLARDVLRTGGVIAAFHEQLARGRLELGQALRLAARGAGEIRRAWRGLPMRTLADFRPGRPIKSM